jgi:hypothetical protein
MTSRPQFFIEWTWTWSNLQKKKDNQQGKVSRGGKQMGKAFSSSLDDGKDAVRASADRYRVIS